MRKETEFKKDANTKLAMYRTHLAQERTLMAWIRTAVSLISFGFTIYKFFQWSGQAEHAPITSRLIGPRELALGMLGLGVAALVLATLEHRKDQKLFEMEYGTVWRSQAEILAAAVSAGGLLLLFIVIFDR